MTRPRVAERAGRLEPSVLARSASQLAKWLQSAGVLVERNNHGPAGLRWLREHGRDVALLPGHDRNAGWLSSTLGKTQG